MRVVEHDELPQSVQLERHRWIQVRDGTRLAARIWRPSGADAAPVPAILEAVPYRKNDWYAHTDERRHRYLAAHGYVTVRLDLRGSGDSEGVLEDEYLPQEQHDLVDVIAWLADQPWCDGSVGMMGLSWGGFNALQVAALGPPALKAIIAIAASDDRYTDDVHYAGGCVLAAEMLPWASRMLALNARPPDPAVVGAGWRRQWLDRMERTPPFVERWLSHQRYDDYWRAGSVREDYDAIACPVYAVSGWADAYRDAVLRLVEHLPGRAKGLIGPWAHAYPEFGRPGPAIGFLQESLRWWDHWLKGRDTGIADEPPLRVWMQDWSPPDASCAETPGRWVAEAQWPPTHAPTGHWRLTADGRLRERAPEAAAGQSRTIPGDERIGRDAGLWLTNGTDGTLPPDQCDEDARSLTFTSEPLTERVEILGHPALRVVVASDEPVAMLSVRLCDVAPDGSSLLVTRAVRNLAGAEADEAAPRGGKAIDEAPGPDGAEPAAPGRPTEITVPLASIAHAFPPGHRIRVAVSTGYWPWIWPSPVRANVTLHEGGSLSLPVRRPRADDADLTPFEPAETAPPPPMTFVSRPVSIREVAVDSDASAQVLSWRTEPGREEYFHDDGLRIAETREDRFTIAPGDPGSAEVRTTWTIRLEREGWCTRVETDSVMTSDGLYFSVDNLLEAYEDERQVFRKAWTFKTLRDGV